MKIAVLGSNGFVGNNVTKHLSKKYSVTPVNRNTIDLLNPHAVKNFLKRNSFDVVVNCAAVMTNDALLHDARNNLGIFMNFFNNFKYFGKFINTGSGAEFNRSKDINCKSEEEILYEVPSDSYGWGQNVKSQLCLERENFYTLRIFNCFGPGELPTRLFPRYLNRNETFRLVNDRYFDYFGINDLNTMIQNCIENDWMYKDVNAVYKYKYKISEVLAKFCEINGLEKDFEVVSVSDNNYTGDAAKLEQMNIKMNGLDIELSNYCKELQ